MIDEGEEHLLPTIKVNVLIDEVTAKRRKYSFLFS